MNATKYIPLLYLGLAAVTAYLVWKSLKFGADKAGIALDAAQASTTDLIERFFPLTSNDELTTYAVFFSDERVLHAVNGEDIDSGGYFVRGGTRYRIIGRNANGNYVAEKA